MAERADCTCTRPVQVVDPSTGERFCDPDDGGCGGRILTRRERVVGKAIVNHDRRITELEHAASSNGNGSVPHAPPPDLAQQIAKQVAERLGDPRPAAVTYERAARMLGVGRTLFIEEVLPHVNVLRIRGKRVVPVAELERFAAENMERWVSEGPRP